MASQRNAPLFPKGSIYCRIASTFPCGLPFGGCGIHQESSTFWVCPVEETPVINSNSQLLYNFVEMYEHVIYMLRQGISENFLLLWCFSTSPDFQKSCKNSVIDYSVTVILHLTNSIVYKVFLYGCRVTNTGKTLLVISVSVSHQNRDGAGDKL